MRRRDLIDVIGRPGRRHADTFRRRCARGGRALAMFAVGEHADVLLRVQAGPAGQGRGRGAATHGDERHGVAPPWRRGGAAELPHQSLDCRGELGPIRGTGGRHDGARGELCDERGYEADMGARALLAAPLGVAHDVHRVRSANADAASGVRGGDLVSPAAHPDVGGFGLQQSGVAGAEVRRLQPLVLVAPEAREHASGALGDNGVGGSGPAPQEQGNGTLSENVGEQVVTEIVTDATEAGEEAEG